MANNNQYLNKIDTTTSEINDLIKGLSDLVKAFNSTSDSILKFNKNITTIYSNFA